MAVDSYQTASKVRSTPSMLEVIYEKGFGSPSLGVSNAFWQRDKGLIHLCSNDINPNSPAHPTRVAPYSLLSLRGYSHFFKVYPDGFSQNNNGKPGGYASYENTPRDGDTAFIEMEADFGGAGNSQRPPFLYRINWVPESYRFGTIRIPFNNTSTGVHNEQDSTSWAYAEVINDIYGFRILVSVKSNSAYIARKGYLRITIQPPNGHSYGTRSFGIYIHQRQSYRQDYPLMEMYSGRFYSISASNQNDPYIIRGENKIHMFVIGGEKKLSQVKVYYTHGGEYVQNNNSLLQIRSEALSKPYATGEAGSVGIEALTGCPSADLRVYVSWMDNGRLNSKNYYLSYR